VAVILGNHIYVTVKLNEANDPYKLLLNINRQIKIGDIYRGISNVNRNFTQSFLFELLDTTGFEIITFEKIGVTIIFISKKVDNR